MTQIEKIKKDIHEMETALSMPSINDMPKVKARLETDLKTAKGKLESLQKKSNEIDIEAGLKEIADKEWPKIKEKLEAKEGGKKLVEELEQFKESNIPPLPSDMQTGQQLLDKWAKEGQKPMVMPKPTATIHFAGQQYPGKYTRGELWSDVRQNFKLVLLSATFRRCLSSGDYSELWSMVLFVKLYQGIHEGLKKLEGGKDYAMEELLIRHWAYGDDLKEAGRVLADFLKQPKP